jgi:thiol-disulfide isomerase/thioredoxin
MNHETSIIATIMTIDSFAQQSRDILHELITPLLATMHNMERYKPSIKAPDFPPGLWLNALEPVTLTGNAGKIVLIDIFDFTCINCIRMLPYLRAWQERYETHGLKIIGIHTPEFKFAHDPEVVKAGIHRLGVHWPVILDNDQMLWTAFANRYWPSLYLIDAEGRIRYRHVGEGNYRAIETKIIEMLQELEPEEKLPDLMPPIRPEDAEGAFCAPTSPEVQLDAVDQIEQDLEESQTFQLPESLKPNRIYLQGSWRVTHDGISLTSQEGEIALGYEAAKVHAVLALKPDDRKRLPFTDEPLYIQVLQDGEPLRRSFFGEDVQADGDNARFRVELPRLYSLVENTGVESHELRLKITQTGLTFYAFSFGSCLSEDASQQPRSKE